MSKASRQAALITGSSRGIGLDWSGALELIQKTRAKLPDALVFNGAGTELSN